MWGSGSEINGGFPGRNALAMPGDGRSTKDGGSPARRTREGSEGESGNDQGFRGTRPARGVFASAPRGEPDPAQDGHDPSGARRWRAMEPEGPPDGSRTSSTTARPGPREGGGTRWEPPPAHGGALRGRFRKRPALPRAGKAERERTALPRGPTSVTTHGPRRGRGAGTSIPTSRRAPSPVDDSEDRPRRQSSGPNAKGRRVNPPCVVTEGCKVAAVRRLQSGRFDRRQF